MSRESYQRVTCSLVFGLGHRGLVVLDFAVPIVWQRSGSPAAAVDTITVIMV